MTPNVGLLATGSAAAETESWGGGYVWSSMGYPNAWSRSWSHSCPRSESWAASMFWSESWSQSVVRAWEKDEIAEGTTP